MATMRDDRYDNVAPLEKLALEQGWANGCEHCHFGLIAAPVLYIPLVGPDGYSLGIPLYLQRVWEHRAGLLAYCTCRAGRMYQKQMERRLREVESERDIVSPVWNDALYAYTNAQVAAVAAEPELPPTIHCAELVP